jgi:RIO kinase 1
MLARDVNNMRDYYAQFAPELAGTQYAKEIWALYEEGNLHPEVELTGYFAESGEAADVDGVMEEIAAAFAEEQERLERIRESVE